MNKKIIVSVLAVLANFILAVGKLVVGFIAGSAAVFADGINSGTDVLASTIGFIGIKAAEKPADKEHPYGHEKAEVIAGFVITLIILTSGAFIILKAIREMINPSPVQISILAFAIMGLSALINLIMSQTKIYYGKKYDSVSLISDGLHSRIDLLVSLVIFLGLFLVKYSLRIDSILALIVGAYILKESFSLGKETTDSLLGRSAGKEIEDKIREIIKNTKISLIGLKTQKLGSKIFAELKIKLPNKLKVEEADKIRKKLEKDLNDNIRNLEYTSIQIESHDISTGFYKSTLGLGKGYGWKRKGKFKKSEEKEIKEKARGKGPEGECVCEKCGYKIKHERGKPCSTIKCKKCGGEMIRK